MIIGPPPRRFDELSARFVDERAFGLVGVLTSTIAATSVAAERTKDWDEDPDWNDDKPKQE